MANSERITNPVMEYYDAESESLYNEYDRKYLYDTDKSYPSNYIRLQLLLNAFSAPEFKRVIEIGVGEGTPLAALAQSGLDVRGCDISPKMVEKAKKKFAAAGLNPEHIFWADVQDPITYQPVIQGELFDGLISMGVMPHVENEKYVLRNMRSLIRSGGKIFVMFRNKLFSLFTFNRYTLDFIMSDLLENVDEEIKEAVAVYLKPRLQMDAPKVGPLLPNTGPGAKKPITKFHNPFTIKDLFRQNGFEDVNLLWYHYHPAMPIFEAHMPEIFRAEGLKLEHGEINDWKGYFLCSAFIVQATKE